MYTIKIALVLISSLFLFAYSSPTDKGIEAIYGITSHSDSPILLTLHDDFTFSYRDLSNPNRLLRVSGTYTKTRNKIEFQVPSNSKKFHSKWRIIEGGNAAKSRSGLSFYTLRKLD